MKKNLTSSPAAAPESGCGPAIFKTVLGRLAAETADNLQASELPPEDLKVERCRLAMLRLAAASALPFSDFFEEFSELASAEVLPPLYAQIDTLNVLYDVCTGKES